MDSKKQNMLLWLQNKNYNLLNYIFPHSFAILGVSEVTVASLTLDLLSQKKKMKKKL